MLDLQRKKAVQDMERKKKQEEIDKEKVLVSPGLNPSGVQGEITRGQFNEFQRQKQTEQLNKQNLEIQRKQEAPNIAGQIGNISQTKQQPGQEIQPTEETPINQEPKKLSKLEIAKNLAFGNILETNPYTGERVINPETGKPVEVNLGYAPMIGIPSGAIAQAGAVGTATTGTTGITIPTIATKIWTSIKGNQLLSIAGVWKFGSMLESNKKQKVKEFSVRTSTSSKNLGDIITAANKGYISPQDAVTMYNTEWNTIYKNERALSVFNQGDLQWYAEGHGTDELIRLREMIEMKVLLDAELRRAILMPNPNAINTEFGAVQMPVETA